MKMKRKYLVISALILLVPAMICLFIVLFHQGKAHQQQIEAHQQQIEAQLEEKLQAWGKYLQQNPWSSDLTGNEYYRDIIDLGIPALPYLMEKIEKGNWSLSDAVDIISQKRFEYHEYPGGTPTGLKAEAKLLIQWWPKARKGTPQKFRKLYSEWKSLKNKGNEKEKEEKDKLEQIRALGIAALPMIIEKVGQGDNELIPIVYKLTKSQVDPNTSISQCFAWWVDNKKKWLIPFPNNTPIAKAGKDKTATSGDTVQIDGSASSDEDKDELTYKWTQTAGPPVKLSDETGVKPTFKAPEVKVPTVLTFELKVNDAGDVFKSCPTPNSESKPDTIKITVNPR